MSISPVIRAPSEIYKEDDNCPVCFAPLSRLLKHRQGNVVIHNNSNGSRHPMHESCIKTHLVSNHRFDIGIGNCPMCRDQISWPKPTNSLIKRIAGVSTCIIITGAAHATFSYLTGRPIIVAITPGVISSLMSIESFWLEHERAGITTFFRC